MRSSGSAQIEATQLMGWVIFPLNEDRKMFYIWRHENMHGKANYFDFFGTKFLDFSNKRCSIILILGVHDLHDK